MIAAITSNAWLGKAFGQQFRRFLLDNFHVKYVIRTVAGHWFTDSKVSTVYITLQRGAATAPTRFITINRKLEALFSNEGLNAYEDFYAQIDNCEHPANADWEAVPEYTNVYKRKDGDVQVSIVPQSFLTNPETFSESWARFFISADPFAPFRSKMIPAHGALYTSGRGTKTRWDALHIISDARNEVLNIEEAFLLPILKNSSELTSIAHTSLTTTSLFICDVSPDVLSRDYPNAYKHIRSFENELTTNGKPLVKELSDRRPFWYTLSSEDAANVFISINPSDKLFFSYTESLTFCNQRLVAIRVNPAEVELAAALLNSVVSLLFVEMNGTPRNMGALDLEADFFKKTMKVLNPALLSDEGKNTILQKFRPLSTRAIKPYNQEYSQSDRKAFDKAVLVAFGYDVALLPKLYALLIETIKNRVEMQHR